MKVMIVDDHILFREGLASILMSDDIEIAGLAGSIHEAVAIAREMKPDIILMDFGLSDGTGAEATRSILKELPNCKIIFLTASEQNEHLFDAIRSGAKGYLLKNISPIKLITALRSVQRGEGALSRTMTLRLMEEFTHGGDHHEPVESRPVEKLTPREEDVLGGLADGKTNQEIAASLCISENTVRFHIHSILEKLDLPDRKAAGIYFHEHRPHK